MPFPVMPATCTASALPRSHATTASNAPAAMSHLCMESSGVRDRPETQQAICRLLTAETTTAGDGGGRCCGAGPVALARRLLRLHALQREAEPQHRGVEQPARVVPQRAVIRQLCEQLEDGMHLRRR